MAERTKTTHAMDARNKSRRRGSATPDDATSRARRSTIEGRRAHEKTTRRTPDAGTDKRTSTGTRRVGGRKTSTVRRGGRSDRI